MNINIHYIFFTLTIAFVTNRIHISIAGGDTLELQDQFYF